MELKFYKQAVNCNWMVS